MNISALYKEVMEKDIKLLILRGASGSGKSTLASCFPEYKQIEADEYFMGDDGEYYFAFEELYAAHKWCQRKTYEELARGGRVVMSNTNIKLKEIKPYIEMCEELKVSYMIIRCIGKYQNAHGVPEDRVEAMRKGMADIEGEVIYDPMDMLE